MSRERDLELSCASCGDAFVFSAGEQAFYAEKELQRPRRCASCRAARRPVVESTVPASAAPHDPRQAVCSACGALTRLKFVPESQRPVYCDPCFRNR